MGGKCEEKDCKGEVFGGHGGNVEFYILILFGKRSIFMVITMQQLKIQPGKIFSEVSKGQEMAVSYRGKICAKIIPFNVKKANNNNSDNELFGMWKDRDDIGDASQYVRKIRKARKLC